MPHKPGEVCDHTGFGEEKLRYWRDLLETLHDKKGNCRCYTNNDMVGLLAVNSLLADMDGQIGSIVSIANQIIRFCQREPRWKQLAHYMLVVFPAHKEVELVRTEDFQLPLGRGNFTSIFLSVYVDELLSSITGDDEQETLSDLVKERRKRVEDQRRGKVRKVREAGQ